MQIEISVAEAGLIVGALEVIADNMRLGGTVLAIRRTQIIELAKRIDAARAANRHAS